MTDRRSNGGGSELHKTERLLNASAYRRAFRHGKCYRNRVLRIYFVDSRHELSRLGLVVSRKMGNAVVRNKIKRRLREVFRTLKDRLPRPLDLVIITNPEYSGPVKLELYRDVFDQFLDWVTTDRRRAASGSSKTRCQ